jgi:hypothetical protein
MLVLGLKILLGMGIVPLAIYMQYRRRMRWSMRHDLLEKTKIQTVFGEDHSRDPFDDAEFNKLK